MIALRTVPALLARGYLTLAIAAALALPVAASPETVIPVGELSHIHGVEFDPSGSQGLLLATHSGLFRVSIEGGLARLISADRNDYMGFTLRSDDGLMLASGHPAVGGNMGIVTSENGGETWLQVSEGADGPVDFHAIAISETSPMRAYGLYRGGVQVSSDGGFSWSWTGLAPTDTFDLAATGSALLAATRQGLMSSSDDGRTWVESPGGMNSPVSLVEVSGDKIYAFFVGQGLVRRALNEDTWTLVSNAFEGEALLHLAISSKDGLLAAVTQNSRVLVSNDDGLSWSPLL